MKIVAAIPLSAFFCFLIVAFLGSCRKNAGIDHSVTVNTVDTTITDTTLFIDITLNGNRVLGIYYGPNSNNTSQWSWGNIWGYSIPDTTVFQYDRVGTIFQKVNTTKSPYPEFSFSKGDINLFYKNDSAPTAATLPVNLADSFFAPGPYSYSVFAGDTSFDHLGDTVTLFTKTITLAHLNSGITLSWVDSTGTLWQTFNGIEDQTGSSFTITKFRLQNTASGYASVVTLEASFTCKLYDGKGHMIQLTNGRFRQMMWI